jgi:hypothetical protein
MIKSQIERLRKKSESLEIFSRLSVLIDGRIIRKVFFCWSNF